MGRFGKFAVGAALAAGLVVMGSGCAPTLGEGSAELADMPAESVLSAHFAVGGKEMTLASSTAKDIVYAIGSKATWSAPSIGDGEGLDEEAEEETGTEASEDAEGEAAEAAETDTDEDAAEGDSEDGGEDGAVETDSKQDEKFDILAALDLEVPANGAATIPFAFLTSGDDVVYEGEISVSNTSGNPMKLGDCSVSGIMVSFGDSGDASKPNEAGYPTVQLGGVQLGSALEDVYTAFGDPMDETADDGSDDTFGDDAPVSVSYNFAGGILNFAATDGKINYLSYSLPDGYGEEDMSDYDYPETFIGAGDANSFAKKVRAMDVNNDWQAPVVAATTIGGHKVDFNITDYATVKSWNLGNIEVDPEQSEDTLFTGLLSNPEGQSCGSFIFTLPFNKDALPQDQFVFNGFTFDTPAGLALLNIDGLDANAKPADVLAKFGRPETRTGTGDNDCSLMYSKSFQAGDSMVYMDLLWVFTDGALSSVQVSTAVSPLEDEVLEEADVAEVPVDEAATPAELEVVPD